MANLTAGIGEICVSRRPDDIITALGLGSCVAIVLYDPHSDIIGVAHCMLPTAKNERKDRGDRPGRYVDVAVPELLSGMCVPRTRAGRLAAALAGGAAMFEFTGPTKMDIGRNNIAAAEQVLTEHDIPVLAADTGGVEGRTLKVRCDDGTVTIRSVGNTRELICFHEWLCSWKAA